MFISQAVRFLHTCGVILHYEDSTLKLNDFYFLDPEWLCRLMAQIITVREINPCIGPDGVCTIIMWHPVLKKTKSVIMWLPVLKKTESVIMWLPVLQPCTIIMLPPVLQLSLYCNIVGTLLYYNFVMLCIEKRQDLCYNYVTPCVITNRVIHILNGMESVDIITAALFFSSC